LKTIILIALTHALIFLTRNAVTNAHFVCVYLSGKCQSIIVWPSMFTLNSQCTGWYRCEISPSWAWQL